jgi:hypothetical protein
MFVMEIHRLIKEVMTNHKAQIQLIQWAVTSGISSFVYSEYLRRLKQKITPIRLIMIPQIKTVDEFLKPENQFMSWLSDKLIDQIVRRDLFKQYSHAPDLSLFGNDNIEILKTILDFYIIPNAYREIPTIIRRKFDLENPQQQVFRESRELDLFERKKISDYQFSFVVDEIILQLLLLIPTMKKNVELSENNEELYMNEDEILTIGSEKAICGIHFNTDIIENESVIDLLKFVTSTTIETCSRDRFKDSFCKYRISTSPFNTVAIIQLKGIEITEEDN